MPPSEQRDEEPDLAGFSNEVLDDLGGNADRYKAIPIPPVLIVDDDPSILELFRAQMKMFEYECVYENSALKAQELIVNGGSQFSCIITDYMMPDLNGLDLLKQAKTAQPDALRILISGMADLEMAVNAINTGNIFRFLLKPTHMNQLELVIKDAELAYRNKAKERLINEDVRRLAIWLKTANQRLEKNFEQIIDVFNHVVKVFSPFVHETNAVTMEMIQAFCDLGLFTPKQKRILKLAAQFQNVGLLGISRTTIKKSFFKPDELNEDERSLIKGHPLKAAEMLHFAGDSEEIFNVIKSHHERWDGSGYPDGISSHLIPSLAQYLALAAYYAECPYYGEDVIWRIRREKDKAFSPEVMEAFEALVIKNALPRKTRELDPSQCISGMILARDVMDLNGVRILAAGRVLTIADIRYLNQRSEDETISVPLSVKVRSETRASKVSR